MMTERHGRKTQHDDDPTQVMRLPYIQQCLSVLVRNSPGFRRLPDEPRAGPYSEVLVCLLEGECNTSRSGG